MKKLKQSIKENFGELTEKEIEQLLSYFKKEQLSKNDFFVKTGNYCNRLSFIQSGIFRIFTTIDGKEITQWISKPNYFITEIPSYFFNQCSRWTIQALTDSSLLTINKKDYYNLAKEFPKWTEIEKNFIAKCFVMLEDRVFTHLSMTAEERYNSYFQENKELFNQIPLQYIASLLGMSAETLSRIRSKQ